MGSLGTDYMRVFSRSGISARLDGLKLTSNYMNVTSRSLNGIRKTSGGKIETFRHKTSHSQTRLAQREFSDRAGKIAITCEISARSRRLAEGGLEFQPGLKTQPRHG